MRQKISIKDIRLKLKKRFQRRTMIAKLPFKPMRGEANED